MKIRKKIALLLAIAGVSSAVALVGCGDDPAEQHVHDYKLKSSVSQHWEECECGDKKDPVAHEDKKNNDSEAEGKDGKCDVCGYVEQVTVSYDVKGVGTAPASKTVDYGKVVAKPDVDPKDATGEQLFDGWYADAEWKTPYDFTAAVKANVTVYAKWKPNDTEGETAKYAFALTKGEGSAKALGEYGKLYFKFTAPESGRYTISIAGGTNGKYVYATDKDEYVAKYDKDKLYSFELEKNATIVILVTAKEGATLADGDKVTIVADNTVNEPLPEDAYLDGEYLSDDYSNDGISLEIDRNKKQVIWMGNTDNPYSYTYVGGSVDVLTFIVGTDQNTLKRKEDGKYEVTYKKSDKNRTEVKVTLTYQVPQAPIAFEKFVGTYEPADSAADGITQIVIYPSGKVLCTDSFGSDKYAGTFNQNKNTLSFSGYTVTVKLNGDGNAESINVSGKGYTNVVYTYKGVASKELPDSLPLDDGEEYIGESLSIDADPNGYRWGDYYSVRITDYDEDSKVYTVAHGDDTYKLKLESDNTVIKVYAEDGTTLVDTLKKLVYVFHDLPVAQASETLAADKFQKDYYLYKVKTAGWYQFSSDDEYIVVYYNIDESDVKNISEDNTKHISLSESKPVYLTADSVVAVSIADCDQADSYAWIVAPAEEPAGYSKENPLVITNGSASIDDVEANHPYYFSYTAPAEGKYLVYVSGVNSGWPVKNFHYKIGDTDYGYIDDDEGGQWVGGVTYDNPYAKLTLTANQTIIIVADRASDIDSATVIVMEDYSENATSIESTSGTLESGVYNYDNEDDDMTGFVLTSDADFTITFMGKTRTVDEIALTPAQLALGFKLEVASGKSVSYKAEYVLGTQHNPIKLEPGEKEVEYYQDKSPVYVEFTAPSDCVLYIKPIEVEDYYFDYEEYEWKYGTITFYIHFDYNDKTYGYDLENNALELTAGETYVICLYCDDWDGMINLVFGNKFSVNATELEFTKGEPANNKITATATQNVSSNDTFYIASTNDSDVTVSADVEFTITLDDGEVIHSYGVGTYFAYIDAAEKLYFQITFEDESEVESEVEFTFELEFAQGSKVYPFELEFENGSDTLELSKQGVYYVSLPVGAYMATTDNYNYCTFYLNKEEIAIGQVFTVKAGDLFVCEYTSKWSTTEIEFALAVPADFGGKYSYNDGEAKNLLIGVNTVTIGETVYTLTEVNGNAYTFTKAGSEPVVLTLSANEKKFGDNELSLVLVFTEDQAKTYVGSSGGSVELTLTQSGKGTLSWGGYPSDIFVTESEGVYTFSDGRYDYSFTFNEDGSITLIDDGDEILLTVALELKNPTVYSKTIEKTEDGGYVNEYEIELKVSEDLSTAYYSYSDGSYYGSGGSMVVVAVTDNKDGSYSLSYEDWSGVTTITFTISEDGNSVSVVETYWDTWDDVEGEPIFGEFELEKAEA